MSGTCDALASFAFPNTHLHTTTQSTVMEFGTLVIPSVATTIFVAWYALVRPRPLFSGHLRAQRWMALVYSAMSSTILGASALVVLHVLTRIRCHDLLSIPDDDAMIIGSVAGVHGAIALAHLIVSCVPACWCQTMVILDWLAAIAIAGWDMWLRHECDGGCGAMYLFPLQLLWASLAITTLVLAHPRVLITARRHRMQTACSTRRGDVCATRQVSVPSYMLGELP